MGQAGNWQHRPNQHQGQGQARSSLAGPRRSLELITETSGWVINDRSTGIDPGMTCIGTSKETRAGKIYRTPSENLLMADCNLT